MHNSNQISSSSASVLTRRQVLGTAGSGALFVAAGGIIGAKSAKASVRNCAETHAKMGAEMRAVVKDASIDPSLKSMALKISSCPDCGTTIGQSH